MSNQDQQPPWGRKKKPQTPEEMVAQLIKKLQDFFSENNNSEPPGNQSPPKERKPFNPLASAGKIIAVVAIIILAQSIYGSFFTVKPGEVGVILRFGKYTREAQPGLRFKIPFIEELYRVDVQELRRQEFGFRTRTPGMKTAYDSKGYDMESLMLTADKNVISVAWIVQYRINEPYDYLFKVKDVRQAVHDLSESVTRRIVGNMDFDFVLSNRDELAQLVQVELQAELKHLESGIQLAAVQFQDINPPERVKPAFNEVNSADQDMVRLVNEAEEQYNKVIPAAKGNAKQILEQARGYAIERINNAQGETTRFLEILDEYNNAPGVTRQRMYLETMQEILPTIERIYIMDENQQGPLPLLNLGKTGLKVN